MTMLSKSAWARAAALTGIVAAVVAAAPAEIAFAQEAPSVALEQARQGEDGSTGAGATPGSMESGKRDKNGNGENASAGSAGEVATATGSTEGSGAPSEAPLPENAAVLDALGVLDDVTAYDLDVLSGLDIPIEILPPPPAEPESAVAEDINTGGEGADGAAVSTEPGTGSGPAGGSTSSAAEDGAANGEKSRDRPRRNADGATDTATTGDGSTNTIETGDGSSTTGS